MSWPPLCDILVCKAQRLTQVSRAGKIVRQGLASDDPAGDEQVVSSFEMKAGAEQKLNVQKWESGMYYLQLSNGSGTLRKKFEVMH